MPHSLAAATRRVAAAAAAAIVTAAQITKVLGLGAFRVWQVVFVGLFACVTHVARVAPTERRLQPRGAAV
eukprot:6188576-Prymnesium_polylepis.1